MLVVAICWMGVCFACLGACWFSKRRPRLRVLDSSPRSSCCHCVWRSGVRNVSQFLRCLCYKDKQDDKGVPHDNMARHPPPWRLLFLTFLIFLISSPTKRTQAVLHNHTTGTTPTTSSTCSCFWDRKPLPCLQLAQSKVMNPVSSWRPPSSTSSTTTHTPSVPAAATNSRQTADASSLAIILRQRINEIGQEVLRLREEHAALLRAKTKTSAYQGRLETLLREVHTLEAVHADHNLALDKLRTPIDPAQLRLYLKRLQTQNTEAARGVRERILRRQHLEHEAKRLLEERTRRAETEEERVKRFVDSKTFELYQELREQMEMLEGEVQRQEEELAKVKQEEGEEQQQQEQRQQPQKDDPEQLKYQQQYLALRVELRRLEGMRRYLEEEEMPLVSLWAKDRGEAEAQLLARIKRNQQRTDEVEDQCRVLREGGNVGGGGGWEVAVERARKERQQAQEDVNMLDVNLYSSKNTTNKNNNINDDESKKQKTEEHAVTDDLNPDAYNSEEEIMIELLKERANRLEELKKVRMMEGRITVEINGLNKKKESLKEEMSVWARHLLDGGGIKGGGGGGGGGGL